MNLFLFFIAIHLWLNQMYCNTLVPDVKSILNISAVLPNEPGLPFGVSCSNRTVWEIKKLSCTTNADLQEAESYLNETIPPFDDEKYLLFNITGNREIGEAMLEARFKRLIPLVLAECYYWDGRFVKVLENDLLSIAQQKSWSSPAYDDRLEYFNETAYFADPHSAELASVMALALNLLKDKITSYTRKVVVSAINKRLIAPVVKSLNGYQSEKDSWMATVSNWNPITWNGVLISTLNLIDDPNIRSLITGAAYFNVKKYLNVFRSDGFNSESIYFYNLGFSSFITIREAISQVTNGSLDIFDDPSVLDTMFYPLEYGMFSKNGLTLGADFGDCPFDSAFQSNLLEYMSIAFGLKKRSTVKPIQRLSNGLSGILVGCFSDIDGPSVINSTASFHDVHALRKYFNNSGVLVSRKDTNGNGTGLAATIKLLGNYGKHSHNDIGSYSISLNSKKLTGEVGGTNNPKQSPFGDSRYNSTLINSYGHPLPVINGQLQINSVHLINSNSSFKPSVISSQFCNKTDSILYNLTAAYNVSCLASLTRKFKYIRINPQAINITDKVSFTQPSLFEDALTTVYSFAFTGLDSGYFYDRNDTGTKLYVKIQASAIFEMKVETLTEFDITFTRIAIKLTEKVQNATISMIFTATNDVPIPNIQCAKKSKLKKASILYSIGTSDGASTTVITTTTPGNSLYSPSDCDDSLRTVTTSTTTSTTPSISEYCNAESTLMTKSSTTNGYSSITPSTLSVYQEDCDVPIVTSTSTEKVSATVVYAAEALQRNKKALTSGSESFNCVYAFIISMLFFLI